MTARTYGGLTAELYAELEELGRTRATARRRAEDALDSVIDKLAGIPVDDLNVDAVAKATGVARTTLYRRLGATS